MRLSLDIRGQDALELGDRIDRLFAVCDPEVLVEFWLEGDFTPPPVVIVLLALSTHEVPAIGHLPISSDHGHARSLGDAEPSLLLHGKLMPSVDRKFDESHSDSSYTCAV